MIAFTPKRRRALRKAKQTTWSPTALRGLKRSTGAFATRNSEECSLASSTPLSEIREERLPRERALKSLRARQKRRSDKTTAPFVDFAWAVRRHGERVH